MSAHPPPAIPASLFTFETLSLALADPTRLRILRELADGAPRMVVEIARALGRPAPVVSRHLGWLRRTGVVTLRQRLYSLPAHFLPERESGGRTVDLGGCLLRLDRLA